MRFLFTCLPGYGHFLPMVPLARAVAGAGHDLAFATAADFCPKVEAAGFTAFPAGMSLSEQLSEAGRRYEEAYLPPGKERFEAFVPKMLAGVAAPARATDLVPIIEDWKPGLLVHDETDFGGPAAATATAIPYADHSVGMLRPLAMSRLAGQTLAPLATEWGLDLGQFGGLFRYLYLDVCPPSLQSREIDQITVAHPVHNLSVDSSGTDGLPPWVKDLPPVPTVYVSLGTIFNRDPHVLAAIVEGVREERVNVIVTVGPDNDPGALGQQPPNVHVERYIPQAKLLPHCDVVVNQGGTAMLDILGQGLPILVLPQGANQFHNAEACVSRGAGRSLLPGEISPESVRREIGSLLEEPGYRDAARQMGDELRRMPGPEEGVALLERLAEERSPMVVS
jgi:UDP:flavonoid glycosyltransferase YjiC (YdhE family)